MMELRATLSLVRWAAPLVPLVLLSSHLDPLGLRPAYGDSFSWEVEGPAVPGIRTQAETNRPQADVERLPAVPSTAPRKERWQPPLTQQVVPRPNLIQPLPPLPTEHLKIERLPRTASAAPQPALAPPANPPLDPAPLGSRDLPAEVESGEPKMLAEVESAATQLSPAMRSIVRQAEAHTQRGMDLGSRRAYFSARREFIQSLKLVSSALDAEQGVDRHGKALAAGLRALDEADDFVPQDTALAADLNVAAIAAAHRTPVVRSAPAGMTPLEALQQYYTYAQEQLGQSVEHTPAGSAALSGMGKLYSVMALDRTVNTVAAEPKAMTLHQAALMADAKNAVAANELGVLLARFGRYEDARAWLQQSVALAPLPATWHNLAVVHQQLGQPQLAEQARRQQSTTGQGRVAAASNLPEIRWVTAQEIANQSPAAAR